MKILLINPPIETRDVWIREGRCQQLDIWATSFPPISLALLSTALKREGHEVLTLDASTERMTLDQVLECVTDFCPALTITTSATPTIQSDLGWFLQALKTKIRTFVVTFGVHATALPKEVMSDFVDLDAIIMHEPEFVAVELAGALETRAPLKSVKGLVYREAQGVVINPVREPIELLDELGFPDWQAIDIAKYKMPIKGRPFALICYSRGCHYGCTFCMASAFYGKKIRYRSTASLISEIRHNMALGIRDYLLWSEMFTANHALLNEFLDALISSGLNKQISWVCNSRTDTLTEGLIVKMKAAGCWQIAFGLEFASDKMLKLTMKGGAVSRQTSTNTVELAGRHGIVCDGHFMMGHPGETEEDLRSTLEYALSLPLTFAHFYACVPFPGSRLYEDALRDGTYKKGAVIKDQSCSILESPALKSEQVNAALQKAYLRFYLRPAVFYRILRIPQGATEYFRLMVLMLRFTWNSFYRLVSER